MEIKFVTRESVVNSILDEINKGRKINNEVKQILIDFTRNKK